MDDSNEVPMDGGAHDGEFMDDSNEVPMDLGAHDGRRLLD